MAGIGGRGPRDARRDTRSHPPAAVLANHAAIEAGQGIVPRTARASPGPMADSVASRGCRCASAPGPLAGLAVRQETSSPDTASRWGEAAERSGSVGRFADDEADAATRMP